MLEEELRRNIEAALNKQGVTTVAAGVAAKEQTINELTRAIETYTKGKLRELKISLVTPGAFQGAGTGVVAITAAGFATYTP
jgi:hypothetical protein